MVSYKLTLFNATRYGKANLAGTGELNVSYDKAKELLLANGSVRKAVENFK